MVKTIYAKGEVDVLRGKTVLIVEDDEFIFNLLEVMLKGTGLEILHADSGEKAIALVNDKTVDLVLLDIRLPGKDGFEVFEQIRMIKRHMPIVAQTANSLPEEKKKFLAAGYADYLQKPIDTMTIHKVILKLIGSRN